jgi:tryptophan 2,3-dioxygenase
MSEENLIQPEKNAVTYSSYLKIDSLLDMQNVLTTPEEHDETLFIIIHQVYELWFKQILHEVSELEKQIAADNLMPFIKLLNRINTIVTTLTNQIDILETMTPVDFNRFREKLNPASGFQSYQFRLLEFKLGVRDKAYLKFYKHHDSARTLLEAELEKHSVYDGFIAFLGRKGFKIPDDVTKRDLAATYVESDGLTEVIGKIYLDPSKNYDLYLACEALLDFDQKFLLWRYRHVAMVQRMIGARMGTGGSSGSKYLASTLTKRFFPELWAVRDTMGPNYGMKSDLPTKDKK